MTQYHRLLQKQINRCLPSQEIPENLTTFIELVNNAYIDFENDRNLMIKSIEISSREYTESIEKIEKLQTQIVQQEKMVALGQLIAGIAHEINTPIGAIKASNNNIHEYIKCLIYELPKVFRILSDEKESLFLQMINEASEKELSISPREERSYKRKLAEYLETVGINDLDDIVSMLVEMGFYQGYQKYLPLLQDPEHVLIIQNVYNVSNLFRSCKNINTAIDRITKIVFALKNYTHQNSFGVKVISNILAGIDTVLTLYHNQLKSNIEVIRNYEDIPLILCFPDELNQVWTNIIHNAIQAMDYKGTLTIDVSNSEDIIIVKFTDTGKGIPLEYQERIFEPFFTTKPQGEGTGLGLDITRKIILKHNGEIGFNSVPGKTTFWVKLPTNFK